MPPLPPVPQVLKIIVQGNSGESSPITWANILHFQYSGAAPSPSVCNTIATHVQTTWAAHMSAEQVNNVFQNVVEVIDLTSSTAGSGADFTGNAGTRGDDEIPANVAFLVTYPVLRRYRGGHPRTYLMVGGNADFLDAAHWSSAFTTEVGNHWAAFLDAIIGFSTSGTTITNMVNVSYYSGKDLTGKPILRPVPLVDPLTVANMQANQQMASQRRRIGRHRR